MEKLNEVNVMEGIDFKLNQRLSKIEDNIRKEKLRIRKNERFNNILISIAIVIALVITIMLSFMIFKNDDKNINECVEKGYSRPYCEKSIYGL